MFGSVNATAPVVGAVSRNGTSATATTPDDDALMHPNVSIYTASQKNCRCSADVEENVNELHFKCNDFNTSTHVTVYAEYAYAFLSKSCPCR